jgi:TorA maturation chaperone TorD
MTRREMFIESASLKKEHDRLARYKLFAVAFSYPGKELFLLFPKLEKIKEKLTQEYDRLFRASEIWLYCGEHLDNVFQKAEYLSGLVEFYKAFAVEPKIDRPDFLPTELEFMHYLIHKTLRATENDNATISQDAQRKLFNEYIYPSAKAIAQNIIGNTPTGFYKEISNQLLEFLEEEKNSFGG